MKLYARIIAALCALVMLLACFVGCANTGEGGETSGNAQTQLPGDTTAPADDNLDEDGYWKDDIPEELNYNEIVTILNWRAERVEFDVLEEDVGKDMVQDAVYARNVAAQERLGVTFEWTEKEGNNSNRQAFSTYVKTCYDGGTYYDIIATYSRTSAMLCTQGLLQNLNEIENNHINTAQPWWPESMLETCSIKDSLFFVSGDISTNILHFMYAIYYNMDLLEELQLEDPIALVDSMDWTLDKLIEMCSDLYVDLDQSNDKSSLDRYGFCSNYFHLDAFYTGSGMRLIEDDPDGILKISDDFFGDKSIALADKLAAWFEQGDSFVEKKGASLNEDEPFFEGNAVFIQNRVYMADSLYGSGAGPMRHVDWEFGILPTPLYNEDQENYITLLGNPITLWSVMQDARDPSMSTAVIECLASEGYRKTSPALFENNMKYRYTPDTADKGDGARMFDIIRKNISFDLGRIFSESLSYMSEMPSNAAASGQSWAQLSKGQKKPLGIAIQKLNAALEKIVN
jgi:ABC-type glycerol-3-phosphate transport system substrate-binding protein